MAAAAPTTTPHASANRDRLIVFLSLAAVYLIWGSAYLAIRIAIQDIPPFLMGGSRAALAGAILYGFLRARGVPAPTRRQWITTLWISFLMLTVSNGALAWGQQYVASGLASIVVASGALWAALFSGIWERFPTRIEWAGLLVGLGAIAMLGLQTGMEAHPAGALALLLCSVTWALGSIWSRHVPIPRGMMASATQMMVGGPMLVAAGFACGERITAMPGTASLAAWVYLGLISSLLGYSAYTYLIHNTRPSVALSYEYVNPAVAVILGVMFAGERVTAVEIAAMALIAVAVILVMQGRAGHRRPIPEPEPGA